MNNCPYMKGLHLNINRVFYRIGIDLSFVWKEEVHLAMEMNEVCTMNRYSSIEELSDRLLSKDEHSHFQDNPAIWKNHKVDISGSFQRTSS